MATALPALGAARVNPNIAQSHRELAQRVSEDRSDDAPGTAADAPATLLKWSFVFWVSAVGAIAGLAGVLK